MSSAATVAAGWCRTLRATGGALRAAGALSAATAVRLAIHLMAGLLLATTATGLLPRTILAGLSALRGLPRLLRLARACERIVARWLALLLLAPRRIA